ncbi:MAG TPA: hypothetical protein VH834_18945 [Solirubrobacteraceae bacterium]
MQIGSELILLRTLAPGSSLPGPTLAPGAVVAARVLDRRLLSLAGARVPATLPDDVRPGDALRLRVQEAGPERVVLQIVPQAQVPPAATAAVALPGGAFARVIEDEEGAGGGARGGRAVVLRYDSPMLGRLDIRLSQAGATVYASEGAPADAARAAAGDLASALGAPVAVLARRNSVDARA